LTSERQQGDGKSSPAMAKLITVAVLAMAGYSQISTGQIDPMLITAMVALVLIWLGHGVDRFFGP